jgi:hypothetical protein
VNLLHEIHGGDPFHGFAAAEVAPDEQGWNSFDPIWDRLIPELRPSLIIEVGTWKGASALVMAEVCRAAGLATQILCVDTWLGAGEFWEDKGDPDRFLSLRCRHGYPQVYFTFLANVVRRGFAGAIVPFPQTSLIAARWLARRGVQADLIYVDGSHDEQDVAADLAAYWPLIRPGGVLLGDDFAEDWPGVRQAVNTFAREHPYMEVTPSAKWLFRKPIA